METLSALFYRPPLELTPQALPREEKEEREKEEKEEGEERSREEDEEGEQDGGARAEVGSAWGVGSPLKFSAKF